MFGQTKRTLEKRFKAHIYEALSNKYDMYLHRSIRKYGSDSFEIELLENCDSFNVYSREKYYIKTLNSLSPSGYNQHEGGKGGCLNPSPELRKKLSKAKLGKPTWNKGLTKETDSRVAKFSDIMRKTMKGRTKTKTHRENISKTFRLKREKKNLNQNPSSL